MKFTMLKYTRTLLCVLFVIALFDPIFGARGFGGRHSYPSSRGGLSGGGHHSYPSSGGLSGTGYKPPSHGYPSSGGLSGGGGGHSYPSSGGLSGSGSRPQSHGYPSQGSKPNNHYPNSPTYTSHTTVHNNYHYSPPQQIRYASPSGSHVSYPVYHGTPPTYVYQYKDSGSKYGTLLTGLALLNLGVLGGAVYANSQSHKNYVAKPGEVCKFGLRKDNGDYEETKIDCQIISSYIYQDLATTTVAPNAQGNNVTVITTTVTNTTTVDSTNPVVAPMGGEVMLPNGTLVMNATENANNTMNGTSSSTVTVTTTTTNTTTVNALEVKGKPIEVTPTMKCYVIKTSPTSNMRKSVDCGLLQAYAVQSLKKNSAEQNIPTFAILTAILAVFVVY